MPEEMNVTHKFKNNDEKEVEKFVGIKIYSTPDSPGIGGIYKKSYKDFVVKEITKSGKILEIKRGSSSQTFSLASKDKFTTFNLVKVNKATFDAINEISEALNTSLDRFSYSGLKDKCSLSVQRISIKGNWIDKLRNLKMKDMYFRNIRPTRKSVKIGSHWGNNFTIIIRNIKPERINEEILKKYFQDLNNKGFPNFFGLQRFGVYRPNTHKVGQCILEGDYKRAYFECVLATYSTESTQALLARSLLEKNSDLEKAYRMLPKGLNYERKMVKFLLDNPGDYKGTFDQISPNLQKLFISSFQSYLFNKMVSLRVKSGISLFEPVKGDVISILDDDNGNITQIKYLYGGHYDEYLKEAIKLNRAVIVAPIIGFDTQLDKYPLMKKLCEKIVEQEEIDLKLLNSGLLIEYALKGAHRALTVKPTGLNITGVDEDELYPGKKKLQISLSLQKGSYATILLRELMKP